MPNTSITVGTTPVKVLAAVRGDALPGGVSITKTFPGLLNPNGCQGLIIQADPNNGDRIYIGDDSGVSAANHGLSLGGGDADQKESGAGFNRIPLNFWIVGGLAGQILHVQWEYQ